MQSNQRDKYTIPYLNIDRFRNMSDQEITKVIQDDICKYFGIPLTMLRYKTKEPLYTKPVNICMVLMVNYTRYALKYISLFFERTNHTTVLRAVRLITDIMECKLPSQEQYELMNFLISNNYLSPSLYEKYESKNVKSMATVGIVHRKRSKVGRDKRV